MRSGEHAIWDAHMARFHRLCLIHAGPTSGEAFAELFAPFERAVIRIALALEDAFTPALLKLAATFEELS